MPCATAEQLELYNSRLYTVALFFNLAIALGSLVLIYKAIRKIYGEPSTINISTRIFLVVGLLTCLLHQSAYSVLRIQIVYQVLFRLDEPCELYYVSHDCRFVTYGLVAGNSGMILIQSAMTIDRFFATLFPSAWPRLKHWPGVVLSVLVIAGNFVVNTVVFWEDPMTDHVFNCGSLPPKSVSRFKMSLVVAFFMSIAHMALNVVFLGVNVWQDRRQRRTFNVNERYQSREKLKSTQAIFFLSMSQFVFMFVYTILTEYLVSIQPSISPLQYGLALALIYTTPYTCVAIPALIMFTLYFIKSQRMRSINEMRHQTETGDEHMKKIQAFWNK